MIEGSIILDMYEGCNDIGIGKRYSDGVLWAYWIRVGLEFYTTKGKVITLAPPCLGKWS